MQRGYYAGYDQVHAVQTFSAVNHALQSAVAEQLHYSRTLTLTLTLAMIDLAAIVDTDDSE